MMMNVFTDAEIEFLKSQGLGRIATVGADGMPHVIPVAVFYDPQTQALVIGSNAELASMAATKKFRDAQRRPKVAVVVDDRTPRFLEVRGEAETCTEGGEEIGDRLSAPFRFSPAWILIRPSRIVTFGINGRPFELAARDVA
jgi:pyridoxamine 5'-phosphate oxidase family protein